MRLPHKKFLKIILILFLAAGGFLFVQAVFAQDFGINAVNEEIALQGGDPRVIVMGIIRAALGFLGIIALIIVLYGGFVWMTSGGNEEKISKAKKILTNGIIGLVIILSAFGIVQWVISTLLGAAGPGAGGGISGPPAVGRYSGALGNGIIESHYPPRGGTGIARNTKIIVTFKEPMAPDTMIDGYDTNDTPEDLTDDTLGGAPIISTTVLPLLSENIRIYESAQGETGTGGAPNYLEPAEVKVTFTPDLKNFVFDPVEYLGSPSENVWYTVAIKPGVKKADGADAFAGAFRDGYAWDFETSTIIDTTPPQVESYWPKLRSGETVARNTLIQINFDEAMDPTTVSGNWPTPFGIIEVKNGAGTSVAGKWEISNQYKTVEFTTDLACGTNSCGGTVYCLPASEDITVLAKAATLGDTPPEALSPSDGATDAAGNSLDGNKNGTAEGSSLDTVDGIDNFGIDFSTNNEIKLEPPQVAAVDPPAILGSYPAGNSNVPFTAPVGITFNEIMSMGSFSTNNVILDDNQDNLACAVWFSNGGVNLTASGEEVNDPDDDPVKTKAKIYHGDFIPSNSIPSPTCSDGAAIDHDPVNYYPRSTHRVKDIYQNCFYPPAAASGIGGRSCEATPSGTLPAGCPWGTE